MTPLNASLYYDSSCGLCKKEINKLRSKLEKKINLVDISAPDFQAPEGYTLEELITRMHFFDGQTMHIGFNATLGYWRVAGFNKAVTFFSLPGIVHLGNLFYNIWAKWRKKYSSNCSIN